MDIHNDSKVLEEEVELY